MYESLLCRKHLLSCVSCCHAKTLLQIGMEDDNAHVTLCCITRHQQCIVAHVQSQCRREADLLMVPGAASALSDAFLKQDSV